MRFIPSIGVCILFTPLAWKYNNFRAKIITVNGLLCHMNESHPIFKYNDIIWNIILGFYTCIKSPTLIKYQPITLSIFIINVKLYEMKKISRPISECIHVLGVQLSGAAIIYNDIHNDLTIV